MRQASILAVALLDCSTAIAAGEAVRPRARELGIRPGIHDPGPLDAITNVAGVRVGHATIRAVIDATEEAIVSSLLQAETVRGRDGHVAGAIPVEPLREILRRHGR